MTTTRALQDLSDHWDKFTRPSAAEKRCSDAYAQGRRASSGAASGSRSDGRRLGVSHQPAASGLGEDRQSRRAAGA